MSIYRDKWAILIAVNNYQFEDKRCWLRYTLNDIEAIRLLLIDQLKFSPEHIELFANDTKKTYRKPTCGNILHQLELLKRSNVFHNDDLFIFYFSGHGLRTSDGHDILMPEDCSSFTWSKLGISTEEVINALSATRCDNILLFLDACRKDPSNSKNFMPPVSKGIGQDTIEATKKRKGIVTFLSCDPEQLSYEIAELKHGVFTYALLEAFKKGGCRTVSEVYKYIRDLMPEISYQYKKPQQLPFMVAQPDEMRDLELIPATIILAPNSVTIPIHPSEKINQPISIKYDTIPFGAEHQDYVPIPPKDPSFFMNPYLVNKKQFRLFLKTKNVNWRAEDLKSINNKYEYDFTSFEENKVIPSHDDNLPVVGVSPKIAIEYAKWSGGRLPKVSEWEIAARAGREREDWWLQEINEGRVIFHENERSLMPVGSLEPNAYGITDLLGNAREICESDDKPGTFMACGGAYYCSRKQLLVQIPVKLYEYRSDTTFRCVYSANDT